MKTIKVRSPYIITVNESGQTGSKVELFIWNKGTTEPTIPTYTLSKSIVSPTQITNRYNISNYVSEFISQDEGVEVVGFPEEENNNYWAICKVKRYKLVGTVSTLLDTTEYIAVNGYTTYSDGAQIEDNNNFVTLCNGNDLFIEYTSGGLGYVNFIFEKITPTYTAVYLNQSGTIVQTLEMVTGATPNGTYFNFRVPFRSEEFNQEIQTLQIRVSNSIIPRFVKKTITNLECKFTPVTCTFVNRYGGFEFLTFFKQQTNSISTSGNNYKLSELNTPSLIKRMNIQGKQSIKLNTGFVNENYSELITDLMLSENIYLDGKPAIIKTQTSDLKTHLKEKNINYEIEFDYAYNLINDAI